MKRWLLIIPALLLLAGNLKAQNIEDELPVILAGFLYALNRVDMETAGQGRNFDGSLVWAEAESGSGGTIGFSDYSFYILNLDGPGRTMPVLNGELAIEENVLNGELRVNNAAIGSIRFEDYIFLGEEGKVYLDNQLCRLSVFNTLLEEAHALETRHVDLEKEGLLLFYICLTASAGFTWSNGEPVMPYTGDMAEILGERVANEEGTLTAEAVQEGVLQRFSNYASDDPEVPFFAKLSGNVTLGFQNSGGVLRGIAFNGGVSVRGLVFISSIAFRDCLWVKERNDSEGRLAINGEEFPFKDLLLVLELL
jgi:hypothetical protein